MLSSFNKTFYCLVADEKFGFDKKNLLSKCFDISLEYSLNNTLERNLDGELVNLQPLTITREVLKEKFQFQLAGKGAIEMFEVGNKLLLATSAIIMPYSEYDASDTNNRKIMFDYVFESNNIPLENQVSNLAEYAETEDQSNLFFIPLINVYVQEKNIKRKNGEINWQLSLEEI